ncbi:MAG: antitoxin Xre/MbcA/ParS toxin-binding domain-containing protein [Pseudomonadota bacterium]
MRIHSLNLNAKTTDQMIAHLKQGLSTDTFDQLRQRLNISDNALSKIVQIPKRTLDRRRTSGRLNTDESERIFRIAQVNDMAVEVFGSQQKAESWLKKPARGLGGKIPLEYSDTNLGAREVINLLGRIEHGVFPG